MMNLTESFFGSITNSCFDISWLCGFLSWDVLSRLLHYDTIFQRHHMTIFLKRMTSLDFVLLPHSLNNVPLSAEEVKFF